MKQASPGPWPSIAAPVALCSLTESLHTHKRSTWSVRTTGRDTPDERLTRFCPIFQAHGAFLPRLSLLFLDSHAALKRIQTLGQTKPLSRVVCLRFGVFINALHTRFWRVETHARTHTLASTPTHISHYLPSEFASRSSAFRGKATEALPLIAGSLGSRTQYIRVRRLWEKGREGARVQSHSSAPLSERPVRSPRTSQPPRLPIGLALVWVSPRQSGHLVCLG